MIRFYRKIRHSLMSAGKNGRYIKYAIGEIFLVVIGILIALQINNWNEQRKDRIQEQAVLKQLKEDYQANIMQLEEKMTTRKRMIHSAYEVLQIFDNPVEINRDSLLSNIANITDDPTFDPIENDLINSGNIRLITNERLKRMLSNWSSDIFAVKEIEAQWSTKIIMHLEPVLYKLGIGRDIDNSWMKEEEHLFYLDGNSEASKTNIGSSRHNTTVDEIIGSKELEGLAASAISYNTSANIQSEALVKRMNEILDLIDNEIKK